MEVIKSMRELDVPYIALSGGEPTLHSKFREIVTLINEHNIQLDLVTNGSQLVIYKDTLSKVGHLQISLDGASSQTNDFIRGDGSFERTIAQIEQVGSALRNKITLKMVINSYNYKEIVDYIDLAIKLNLQRVSFGWLNDLGRAKGNSNLLIGDRDKLEMINKQKESRKNIEVVPLGTTERCPYTTAVDSQTVKMSLRIDSKGDIYPCQLISCSRFTLGNINKMKLNELLSSDSVNSFFEFTQNRQSKIRECQMCVWNGTCKGGCIGDGMSDQVLYSPDRQCSLRRLAFRENIMKRRKKTSDST